MAGGVPRLSTAAPLGPPRTYGLVVRQAREALRRFRADKAAGLAPKQQPDQPWRLEVRLPIPIQPFDLLGQPAPPLMERTYGLLDEGDFPGGVQQKFRALRPLVEAMLEGYDTQFLGMLESPADGMGCWSMPDATVVANIYNATFEPFADLNDGRYGAKPQQPDHTVIAVNAEWTSSADIGQFWDRRLKQRARELIDDAEWQTLYSCQLLRTSRGKQHGLLVAAWGAGQQLYAAAGDDSGSAGDLLLSSPQPIPRAQALERLNAHAAAARL